ncbi:MAG: FtsX-like permease family protein [bacterium]|nr:FtsX-like permease family protein [bacterium]
MFLKSLVNLLQVDLGMRTQSVLTFRLSPRLNGYTPEQSRALYERVEAEMAAIPGVRGVASSSIRLIAGNNWGSDVTVEGYPRGPDVDNNSRYTRVGPGFFSKMGIPLIAGREFTERDNMAGAKVAVVNERFVEHFLAGRNPLGRKFGLGSLSDVTLDIEIVGIAKDASYSSVKQKPPRLFYVPWRQVENLGSMSFYVRGALEPDQMAPQFRRVMATLDPDLPMEGLRTVDDQVRRSIRNERLVLELAAVFAILATLMAMLGLYGVMAHGVTRRSRELGIRQALGADAGRIRSLIMREALLILGAGLAAGVPAAMALARFTESQLFEVEPLDAMVIVSAVAALTVAALLAGFVPARRATRINPVEALRYE